MTTDNFETADWTAFQASPETGDLKVLNELVVRAGEIQVGLAKLAKRTKDGEALLKDLLENQIPERMKRSGMAIGDSISVGGFTVEYKEQDHAGIPALSTIEKERDPDRRAELEERREKALAFIDREAPSLIKRSVGVSFSREQEADARKFQDFVDSFKTEDEKPIEVVKGMTVHYKTLANWIKEKQSEGHNFTLDELDTLGHYTRKVAKITTK